MPKGASDGEKIPDNNSDQIKQNKNSFYSVTVINPDGNRTVSYYKKILRSQFPLILEIRRKATGFVPVRMKIKQFLR